MMKLLRWFITLLLVLAVGAVIALQFVTFNQFKGLAVQKVKEVTGRDLTIAGDIKVSFYPVLGAKIEKIALSNMPGASQPTMVSVEQVSVGVQLLPLLQKRVELEKIILDKPVVYLEKNAAGKGNWDFSKAAGAETSTIGGGASNATPVRLGGIEISDGTFSYNDTKSGSATTFTKLNATINLLDLDSLLQAAVSAEYKGIPLTLAVKTDSPSALMRKKGSATTLELMAFGIPSKLEAHISFTPTQISATNLNMTLQRMGARGAIEVTLGDATPVVKANLDFNSIDMDQLMAIAVAVQAVQPAPASDGGKKAVAEAKKTYVDPSVFQSFEGSLALSAEVLQTSEWKLNAPKIRANIGNGMVAMTAAGQFSSLTQSPMNISLSTENLVAILKEAGGKFSARARSQDKDIAAEGTLAVVPGKASLTDSTIHYNGQTITGRASITEKAGEQALDTNIKMEKNGRQWDIAAKTPALQKLMQPEGAPLELALESGSEKAEIIATASNANNIVKLNPLVLKLNGGTGKGYITFDQTAQPPKLDANLSFESLDLNPLLAFAQTASDAQEHSYTASGRNSASKTTPLKDLNAQVNLKAGILKAKDLQMTSVELKATVQDGILDLSLPEAGLYQGKTSLKARVDGNTPDPKFEISTEGSAVNIGALMREAMHSNTFAGTGTWKAEINGSGTETPELYPSLNGRGEFAVEQGVVRGMNLFKLMSAVRGKTGAESFVKTTDETNNLNAKGTFEIAKGIITNNDLVVQSPNIEASGKGAISLPQWKIDYRFDPKVGERRKAGEGQKFVGQSVPVLVQGSLDKPRVFPDPKALINTGIDILKGVKELGIGDKIKGVEKYLAPFGLGGSESPPEAPGEPQQPTTTPQKSNPLDAIQGLFGN